MLRVRVGHDPEVTCLALSAHPTLIQPGLTSHPLGCGVGLGSGRGHRGVHGVQGSGPGVARWAGGGVNTTRW